MDTKESQTYAFKHKPTKTRLIAASTISIHHAGQRHVHDFQRQKRLRTLFRTRNDLVRFDEPRVNAIGFEADNIATLANTMRMQT